MARRSALLAAGYAAELRVIGLDPYVGYQALLQRLLFVSQLLGDEYKAGEYVRGLAKLEAEERDRCVGSVPKP